MTLLYYLIVTVHVLAALLWLGGMFFLALVGAPVLRRVEPARLRQELFQQLGLRARAVGWWSLATLLVTGFVMLEHRGLLQWDGVFANAAFWRTSLGIALAVKLVAVTCMLVISVVHDFFLGPAAGRAPAGSPEAIRLRRHAALLARGSAIIGLVIVLAAVRLARGG